MKSRLVELLSNIAGRATSFGEPVLGHLCRMAALEAETSSIPWEPASTASIVCIWDWDVPNDLNHVDPIGAELFGVVPSRASKGLPNDRYVSAVHPEDMEDVRCGLAYAMKTGLFEARYRIIASGQPRWVFGKGFCTVDKLNRPERFAGALMALD
jgi:PAS fold